MSLRFSIVYTTGTVKYLLLCVLSLLKWSNASFRLVANACSPEEVRLLQRLCETNPRLEYVAAPSRTIMRHGELLDYLQSLEDSQYFCFMDSDILATGDFLSEMSRCLTEYAGVFCGTPIWCKAEEQVLPEDLPSIPGHCNRTAEGLSLGSSYFAIYDNRILRQFMRSMPVGFNRYQWSDVPARCQSHLTQMRLEKTRYDTGKLLNILLVADGQPLCFQESVPLQHIGGISAQAARRSAMRLGKRPKSVHWRPAKGLRRWIRRLARTHGATRPDEGAMDDGLRALQVRRRKSAIYFHQLFRSLFEDEPLPAIPQVGDGEIRRRVESATASIVSLYEEFAERLV
jgi:hypothetical protein